MKTEVSLSRAQMAKKWDSYADQLWSMSKEIGAMTWQEDFTVAALETGTGREGTGAFKYVNLPNRVWGIDRANAEPVGVAEAQQQP